MLDNYVGNAARKSGARLSKSENQGDQIGRIFAYWAIINFGQYFENYKCMAWGLIRNKKIFYLR
jgi:hypothetical protein